MEAQRPEVNEVYGLEFPPDSNGQVAWLHFRFVVPPFGESDSEDVILIRKLTLAVPGVQDVFSHKYRMMISRGAMFGWEEIVPQVLEILRSCWLRTELNGWVESPIYEERPK